MPGDSNLTRSDLLVAPRYESTSGVEETDMHRSFQTIQPLAGPRLNGDEPATNRTANLGKIPKIGGTPPPTSTSLE